MMPRPRARSQVPSAPQARSQVPSAVGRVDIEPEPLALSCGLVYREGMGGQRGFLTIIVGIVVLVVASVAIVLLAGQRPPREYPAGSPEATLQAYLVAWEAGDLEATYGSFSQGVRNQTSLDEYRRQSFEHRSWSGPPNGPSRSVFIDRTTVNGDRATLQLTIEEVHVSGMTANRNRYGRVVLMVRESGAWRFDQLFMGLEVYMDKYGVEVPRAAPTSAPTSPTATAAPTSQ